MYAFLARYCVLFHIADIMERYGQMGKARRLMSQGYGFKSKKNCVIHIIFEQDTSYILFHIADMWKNASRKIVD